MKITPELLAAYNNTLANAIKQGKSHFLCKGLECGSCPFNYSECCDIDVKGGGGELRNVPEWKKWFEDLTQNETVKGTCYGVVRTTLHVEAPVERQVASFEELLAELDEFKKDIAVWVQVMNRKASEISTVVPDYMEFHATDAEGNGVIDWAMSAENFGKKKVWIDA